jgi:pimeloyl-ACP methyl ester carboxylesterase
VTGRPWSEHRLVRTSGGEVELVRRTGGGPSAGTVLYFHGGHESATTAPASEIYAELGHAVVTVSRPGYGRTDVGPISPGRFAPMVDEVREDLGIERFVAAVGTSFGGQQAVQYAARHPGRAGSLVLHSSAPSTLPYPDTAAQRLLGPWVFHPAIERHVWGLIGTLMRRAPTAGLRMMLSSLSTVPVASWVPQLSDADRAAMLELFTVMRSGRGFVVDLRHAGPEGAQGRRATQRGVQCPTLVTASRHDRGVGWAHAQDFLATIPRASLAELAAPSHLFWIGPTRDRLLDVVRDFLLRATGDSPG